jgi:hypothetical protein
MRLHGSTTLVMISMPPDIHEGFLDGHVLRAEDRAHGLDEDEESPHVASSVSSGRP